MNRSLFEDSALDTRLPRSLTYGVVLICIAPFLLNLLGIDFASRPISELPEAVQIPGYVSIEAQFTDFSGAFIHTLLEWSAFCIAAFVTFLAFSHYKASGNVTAPIIGIAFFTAGAMDAFHTLAANSLITVFADNKDLVQITWAASRLSNALIMIVGVSLLLLRNEENKAGSEKGLILGSSIVFSIMAYVVIQISATTTSLPLTILPDAIITRPYDTVPLVLFTISGLFLYPLLYRRYPSLLSHALLISVVPQLATQLHMSFGSTALFDNHFNIAHFLKAVAYAVPLAGLSLDFIETHRRLRDSENRQRAIMDASPEMIYVTDRASLRFLYVNKKTVQLTGYSHEELLEMGPLDILTADRQEIEHCFDEVIAAGDEGTVTEFKSQTKGNKNSIVELHRRALLMNDRWLIITIAQDISSRKRAYRKLRETQAELERRVKERTHQLQLEIEEREKASNVKNEFLASMSHELRTPMNSILGFAQLLELNESELNDVQKLHVRHILTSGEHLLNLVTDLLELNRLEEGRVLLQIEHMSTGATIKDCLDVIKLKAEENDIQVIDRSGSKESLPWLLSDAARLKQILLNLLSNAIKFNKKGGSVTVSCSENSDNMFRISVADTGAGIAPDRYKDVFLPFERLGRETGPIEGSGVGLSLAKRLIEMLGGNIGFESELGRGSTFWVELPLNQEPHSAGIGGRTTKQRVEVKSLSSNEDSACRVLLYIEDDPDNQCLMRHIIDRMPAVKIDFLEANNAELGIELAREHQPDLILMDIGLPGMNGTQALRELKRRPETRAIPIIAVSADAMPPNIEAALHAGFEAYITKPINIAKTQLTISETLGI